MEREWFIWRRCSRNALIFCHPDICLGRPHCGEISQAKPCPVSPLVSPLHTAAGFNQPDFCSHLFHILLLLPLDSSLSPPPPSSHLLRPLLSACWPLSTHQARALLSTWWWSTPSDSSHSTALRQDQYSGPRTLSSSCPPPLFHMPILPHKYRQHPVKSVHMKVPASK